MTSGCGCANCVALKLGNDGVFAADLRILNERAARHTTAARAKVEGPLDVEYMTRLDETWSAVKAAHPELSPLEAMQRAQKIIEGGDAGDTSQQLHEAAQRYLSAHPKASYKEAVLEASKDPRLFQRPLAAVIDRSSVSLNDKAFKYMGEHPAATYREALLAVSAAENLKTVKSGPYPGGDDPAGSAAKLDADTQSTPLTDDEITAYAKRKGITYKAALLELDTARLKAGARAKS